jgi:hypothetical protein
LVDEVGKVWSKWCDVLLVKCCLNVCRWDLLHKVVAYVFGRKISGKTPVVEQVVKIVKCLLIFSEGGDAVTWSKNWCRWWSFGRNYGCYGSNWPFW